MFDPPCTTGTNRTTLGALRPGELVSRLWAEVLMDEIRSHHFETMRYGNPALVGVDRGSFFQGSQQGCEMDLAHQYGLDCGWLEALISIQSEASRKEDFAKPRICLVVRHQEPIEPLGIPGRLNLFVSEHWTWLLFGCTLRHRVERERCALPSIVKG